MKNISKNRVATRTAKYRWQERPPSRKKRRKEIIMTINFNKNTIELTTAEMNGAKKYGSQAYMSIFTKSLFLQACVKGRSWG